MKIFGWQTFYIISSFLAGFAVMTVELVAGRIVAPIIGSSVFTWTSVIGITMLGLALGSYAGGKAADKTEWKNSLSLAFLASSIFVSLIPTLSQNTDFITSSSDSILKLNLLLSFYLFLLPTLLIGLIQPIILKKYAVDFSKIGSEYGILSFSWSLGGILGVFLTGFYFISNIGSAETIWIMAIVLFLTGLVSTKDRKTLLIFILAVILISAFIYAARQKTFSEKIVFEKETDYYYARVIDSPLPSYGNSRILALDFDFHSIQTEQPTQDYPEMYPVFGKIKKDIKNILVIGAGAYTMPKYFKSYYKNSDVAVIEVDPEMIPIGENFFELDKYDIKTTVGDAKMVIKKSKEKYDVIFGDAFNSFISVPWYLLTKEWNDDVKERLNNNGIYAVNFISSLSGKKSGFAKSVLKTFRLSFPNFYIFAFGENPEYVQNIVLVGVKGELPIDELALAQSLSMEENSFLSNMIIPAEYFNDSSSITLTDNFSPVEKLMRPTVENYFPKHMFELNSILTP